MYLIPVVSICRHVVYSNVYHLSAFIVLAPLLRKVLSGNIIRISVPPFGHSVVIPYSLLLCLILCIY